MAGLTYGDEGGHAPVREAPKFASDPYFPSDDVVLHCKT